MSKSKIIVIARTRDEKSNIDRFCSKYSWADSILISDGGSKDCTVNIALQYKNVKVRHFTERVSKDGGKTWRNPHGRHINFMIRWAEKESADWIIFDDVDCFPNRHLEMNCRTILETSKYNFAFANRIYTFGTSQWSRGMSLPSRDFEGSVSLYAWRANIGFYASEYDAWVHEFIYDPFLLPHTKILPPYCLLHDYYPDNGSRQQKVKFYHDSGEQVGCVDPAQNAQYNSLSDLEEWMR